MHKINAWLTLLCGTLVLTLEIVNGCHSNVEMAGHSNKTNYKQERQSQSSLLNEIRSKLHN